jgi:hypothetical protein
MEDGSSKRSSAKMVLMLLFTAEILIGLILECFTKTKGMFSKPESKRRPRKLQYNRGAKTPNF